MKALTSKAWLTRFQASQILYTLYIEQIDNEGLRDINPDFYSILAENTRNPLSASAIKAGMTRGNRFIYGTIPAIKIAKYKPLYSKAKLTDWYTSTYAPYLSKVAV